MTQEQQQQQEQLLKNQLTCFPRIRVPLPLSDAPMSLEFTSRDSVVPEVPFITRPRYFPKDRYHLEKYVYAKPLSNHLVQLTSYMTGFVLKPAP